jgi:hypothetical protein
MRCKRDIKQKNRLTENYREQGHETTATNETTTIKQKCDTNKPARQRVASRSIRSLGIARLKQQQQQQRQRRQQFFF